MRRRRQHFPTDGRQMEKEEYPVKIEIPEWGHDEKMQEMIDSMARERERER